MKIYTEEKAPEEPEETELSQTEAMSPMLLKVNLPLNEETAEAFMQSFCQMVNDLHMDSRDAHFEVWTQERLGTIYSDDVVIHTVGARLEEGLQKVWIFYEQLQMAWRSRSSVATMQSFEDSEITFTEDVTYQTWNGKELKLQWIWKLTVNEDGKVSRQEELNTSCEAKDQYNHIVVSYIGSAQSKLDWERLHRNPASKEVDQPMNEETAEPYEPPELAEEIKGSGPSSPFTAETAEQFAKWYSRRIDALFENPNLNRASWTDEDFVDIYTEDVVYHGEREVDYQGGRNRMTEAVFAYVQPAFKSRKSEIEVTLFEENFVCFKEHVTFQTYDDKEVKVTFAWKLTSPPECNGKVQEQTFGHGVSEEEKDASSKAYWDIVEETL